jgi:L-lactate dehydrogenase complex protein LldF
VKVPLHHQLLAWRAELAPRGARGAMRLALARVARLVMERPALFALAGAAARLAGRALPPSWLARLASPWTRGRELPPLPRESFRALHAKRRRRHGE